MFLILHVKLVIHFFNPKFDLQKLSHIINYKKRKRKKNNY